MPRQQPADRRIARWLAPLALGQRAVEVRERVTETLSLGRQRRERPLEPALAFVG